MKQIGRALSEGVKRRANGFALSHRWRLDTPRLIVWSAVAAFLLIVMSQSHYVPIWDSWVYADCVFRAAENPWHFDSYACAGHPTHGYVFLLAVPGLFFRMQTLHLLAINGLLGGAAIISVYLICQSAMPRNVRLEAAIVALAVSVQPVFVASAVFINPDFGVCAFGLILLAALMRRHYFVAACSGLLCVFSKESGFAFYVVALACYLPFYMGRRKHFGTAALAIRLLSLIVPLLAGALYFVAAKEHGTRGQLDPGLAWRDLVQFEFSDAKSRAMWASLFVLQFGWFVTAILAMGCARALWRIVRGRAQTLQSDHELMAAFIASTTAFGVAVLTRHRTDVNARYFTILYPLLTVQLGIVSVGLLRQPLARRALISIAAALFASSIFRTCDPVSKRLYGTFSFGRHEMLQMTSLSRECCGFGVDQLVYNLEFVRFYELIREAALHCQPTPTHPLILPTNSAWNLFEAANPVVFSHAWHDPGTPRSVIYDVGSFMRYAPPVEAAVFLALPNFPTQDSIPPLSHSFDFVETRRFERDGYALEAHRLLARQPTARAHR